VPARRSGEGHVVAASGLHLIHRGICRPHQINRRTSVARVQGNAHRSANIHGVPLNFERLVQYVDDLCGNGFGIVRLA
jgi:hypothetical protein